MLTKTETMLLDAVRTFPDGATAKQIAAALGMPSLRVSQHLGTLFFSGKLARELLDVTRRRSNEYVYRIKPPKLEASPSQWKPEPRFAGSYDAAGVDRTKREHFL